MTSSTMSRPQNDQDGTMSIESDELHLRYDPSFETVLRENDDDSTVPPPPPSFLGGLRRSIFRPKNKESGGDEEAGTPPVVILPSKDDGDSKVEVDAAEQWVRSLGLNVEERRGNRKRQAITCVALCVALALIIGLAAGLSARDDDQSETLTMAVGGPATTQAPTGDLLPPTQAPVSPTAAPTTTTLAPTNATETSCADSLATMNACYEPFTGIEVAFQNCAPEVDDWIGIWSEDDTNNPTNLAEPDLWLWTCGSQDCEGDVEEDILLFGEGVPPGTYVAHLVRLVESVAPYTSSYAVSPSFEVSPACS